MMRIVEAKVYLGYKTLNGKSAKLSGIKDFIYNSHYGLGVRDMQEFLCGVTEAAYKDDSRRKYGYQFIDWLREQDPTFRFPEEFFEYRRLMAMVVKVKHKTPIRRFGWRVNVIKFLYREHPHLLSLINSDGKYKTIEECYFSEGIAEKMETIKPIKIYSNPTSPQLEKIAEVFYHKIGPAKTRLLAYKLIQECKKNASTNSTGHGCSIPSVDPESARP